MAKTETAGTDQASIAELLALVRSLSEKLDQADQKIAELEKEKAKAPSNPVRRKSRHPDGYWREMVPTYLFKDSGKYRDDVTVCWNGVAYKIKRGEEVMVPRAVKVILDQSRKQDAETAELMDREAGEFAAATRAFG